MAIELARRGIDVVVVDEAPSLFSRASRVTGRRLHLGEHYSGDAVFDAASFNTAQRCTVGALAWLSRYPDIAPKHGAWWQLITNDSMTSPEQYESFCGQLRDFHAELARQDPDVDAILGPSEARHRVLKAEEYEPYVAPDVVQYGVQSTERVIDQQALTTRIVNEVHGLPRLTVRLNARVRRVDVRRAAYQVVLTDGEHIGADVVVNCSWHDLRFLSPVPTANGERWTTRLRFIARAAMPTSHATAPSMYFHRGMFGNHTNVDGHTALVMAEPICNFAVLEGAGIPESWRDLITRPSDPARWAQAVGRLVPDGELQAGLPPHSPQLTELWPRLRALLSDGATDVHDAIGAAVMDDYARFVPAFRQASGVRLYPTVVISTGDAELQNPHSDVHGRDGFTRELLPGYIEVFPGKLTYAVVLADQVAATVIARRDGSSYHDALDELSPPHLHFRAGDDSAGIESKVGSR